MVKTIIYTHTVKLSPDKGGKLGRLALTDVSISSAVSFLRFFRVIVLNSSLFFFSDVVFEQPSSWLLSAMFHLFIESPPPPRLDSSRWVPPPHPTAGIEPTLPPNYCEMLMQSLSCINI